MQNVQLSVRRLQHAMRTNGMLERKKEHACSQQACRPMNEPALIARGLLTAPCVTDYVFLCRFHGVHVCTDQLCGATHHSGTCPVSGKAFAHHLLASSYDTTDARTYANEQVASAPVSVSLASGPVKKRARLTDSNVNVFARQQPPEEPSDPVVIPELGAEPELPVTTRIKYNVELVRERVETIVHNLLYGVVRQRQNRLHQERQDRERNVRVARYMQQHHGDVVDLVQIMMLKSHCTRPPPYELLRVDIHRMHHYVRLVMQMYDKIVQFASQPGSGLVDIVAVTLYVLYTMRSGHVLEGGHTLPMDPYLHRFLPPINAIEQFGYNRKKIKQGCKLLQDAYNNAVRKNVASDQLAIQDAGYVRGEHGRVLLSRSRKRMG